MTLLPQADVFLAFAAIIAVGGASVAIHDFVERGMKRRAARLERAASKRQVTEALCLPPEHLGMGSPNRAAAQVQEHLWTKRLRGTK